MFTAWQLKMQDYLRPERDMDDHEKLVEMRAERDAALASCAVLAGLCDVHAVKPKETEPYKQHIEQGFRILEKAKEAGRREAHAPEGEPAIRPTEEAANAFWRYWKLNGVTHRHGFYESTWGAINAALRTSGVVSHRYGKTLDEMLERLTPQNGRP